MALTQQQYDFISKFLNIDLPDVTFVADGATRTAGEPASATVDALIDPSLREVEDGLRSGSLSDAAMLMDELRNLPVPPGATAEEAQAMNTQRDIIRVAAQEGQPSQSELRGAATALDQLVKLQEAFVARLVNDTAAVLTNAQIDHDAMDPEADQAAQDSVARDMQAVRDALTTPPTQAGIDAAVLGVATLKATVVRVNAATEAGRVERRDAAVKFRDAIPTTPAGALEVETQALEKDRKAILDLLPDIPSREQLGQVPDLIRALVAKAAQVTTDVADRKRRADKSVEHRATLESIKASDRVSATEAQNVDEQRQAITVLLPDLPTDSQLDEAEAALVVLRELVVALDVTVEERRNRIERAQALIDAARWGVEGWTPHVHAPVARVTPIKDAVAQCALALAALVDWDTAHTIADDSILDTQRDELDKQKLALGALNTETTEAFTVFDQTVATAKQIIEALTLSPEQKVAFVGQVDTARASGEDGFDGLALRSDAVNAVPPSAKLIADRLAPLVRRLAAVPLAPAGALPAELKDLKDLHDQIQKDLTTVTTA